MRIVLLLFVLITLCFLSFHSGSGEYYHFQNDELTATLSSTNPPAGRTGAPGEGVCTDCHSGSVLSADGVISVSHSGSGEYVVDQTYSVSIESILGGSKNGFEMTILDENDEKAGSFTAGTNSGVTNFSGRQYIRQTASVGVTSWTFDWTAPNEDRGNLWVYFAFNKSNANSNTSGDEIYLGQFKISSALVNDVSEYDEVEKSFEVWFDNTNHSLKVDFVLPNQSDLIFVVQSLNGQKILSTEVRKKAKGQHQDYVQIPEFLASGIYVVSMLNENRIYSRKVFIP